jgi:RNA polymerase-binding protein DksA
MALTSNQLEKYRHILSARRDELASGTARAESAVNDQEDLGRLDYGDRATGAVAKEDLLQEAGRESEQLAQVEAALGRMREGSYGFCAVCGREIPVTRLDAVPWTTLCIRDQEIADQKRLAAGAMPGGAPSRVAS